MGEQCRMYVTGIGCESMNSSDTEVCPVAGCCAHCSETSGSIKDEEFLDELSGYQHLKMIQNYGLCHTLLSLMVLQSNFQKPRCLS
jgi:hypothetical protein